MIFAVIIGLILIAIVSFMAFKVNVIVGAITLVLEIVLFIAISAIPTIIINIIVFIILLKALN